MFDSIIYLLYGIAAVFIILSIYCIFCYINLKKFHNDNSIDAKEKLNHHFTLNYAILIIRLLGKKLINMTNIDAETGLDTIVRKVKKQIIISIGIFILIATGLIVTALGLSELNNALKSVASAVQSIFNHKDCICYAECTNDTDIDSKCTYELIFGPTEYQALIAKMKLTKQAEEEFQRIESGQKIGEFIIANMNDDMVLEYKKLVNRHFRSKDKKDRSQMSNDELKNDLIELLSDYKVNGRNPNCKVCKNSSKSMLKIKCIGEKHWKEGWHWDYIGDNGDNNVDSGDDTKLPNSSMGNATGQYAVQLDDGMYYWYHQDGGKGCGCVYCGNWSSAQWGSSGQSKHAFGSDGCAVYSLAIGISNLYGAEITPAVVFNDLESPITNGQINTSSKYFNGRNIKRDAVVTTLASKYGLIISQYTYNGNNIDETKQFIDGVLAKGGIVWGSWIDSQTQWCGNGSTHFMCIRKSDGNNYYCFTSCKGKCSNKSGKDGAIETMNYPLNKNTCISGMVQNQVLYGFVNPNAGSGGDTNPNIGNVPSISPNQVAKEVYSALKSWGYSDEAAAGIMGNMLAESGMQYTTTQGHSHDGYTNQQCLDRGCKNSGSGNAHGLIQWDSGRRDSLIDYAINTGRQWGTKDVQLEYLKGEIVTGSYAKYASPNDILKDNNGNDSVEWACYKWCRYVEVCKGVTKTSGWGQRSNFDNWTGRLNNALGYYKAMQAGEFN